MPTSFSAFEPITVLRAMQNSFAGLGVCIKKFDPSVTQTMAYHALGAEFASHRAPFCRWVKRKKNDLCRQCDLEKVPAQSRTNRSGFVYPCHAGGLEMILPVFAQERLLLVLYIGPFRENADGDPKLPCVAPEEMKRLWGLAFALRGYLEGLLRTPRFGETASPESRASEIKRFFKQELKQGAQLSALSRALSLSPSRCSHVVQEIFGISFTEFRDRKRLQRAKQLLKNTGYTITFIASESGFSDVRYFCRFFRHKTGRTPSEYRCSAV